jgi:hypothetical protein
MLCVFSRLKKGAYLRCVPAKKIWMGSVMAALIVTLTFHFISFPLSNLHEVSTQAALKQRFQESQHHSCPSHVPQSCVPCVSSSTPRYSVPVTPSIAPNLVRVRPRVAPLPNVTAILLSWKRRNNLIAALRQLERTSWVQEVLVWNNNPDFPLALDFFGNCTVALRVHNSPVNFKDEAKYRACAMASHSICLYHDDDWDPGQYLEGLWHSFLIEPDHLHTVTDAKTAWGNWHWTFYDAALGLHTGHAWIGCGAIFRRAMAEEFLRQLYLFHVPPEHRLMADCFFSLWQNRFPRILVQRIVPRETHDATSAPQGFLPSLLHKIFPPKPAASVAFSSQPGFMEHQIKSQIYGIETVRQRLASGEHWGSADTQSRWAYGDGFIFLATVGPVDVLRTLSWPAEYDRGTPFRELPNNPLYYQTGPPSILEGRCWKGIGSAGYMLTVPRSGRSVAVATCLPLESMTGMRLWASRVDGDNEMELLDTVEKHQEGRMIFELAEGPAILSGFLVQPFADFTGEMSVCGFEIL